MGGYGPPHGETRFPENGVAQWGGPGPPLRDRSPLLKEIIIFTCYGLPSLNGGGPDPPIERQGPQSSASQKKVLASQGPGLARPRPGPGLNRPSQIIKMGLNGVQVAPFGLKLCQNDAPDLRIILEALLGPKTLFKNQKSPTIIKIPSFTVKH